MWFWSIERALNYEQYGKNLIKFTVELTEIWSIENLKWEAAFLAISGCKAMTALNYANLVLTVLY